MSTDGRYMYHHQPGIGASYDYAPYPPPPPPSSYDNSQISQPPPRQMRPVSTSSQSPTQPYNHPPPPPTTSAAYPPPPSYAPNPYMTPTHPTQQQHPPPPPTQWTSESWAHYNQGYAHQPPSHPPPAHPPPSSSTEPPQYSSAHSHHAHTHPHPHSHSHPPPPPHTMHQAPPPPHPSSSLRSTNVSGGSSVAEPQRGYSSGGSSNASTAAPGSGPAPGSSYLEPRRLDERQHPPPLLTQSSSSSAQQHHQHHQQHPHQHPHQQHQPPHHPTQAQHHHQGQPPPPSHSMPSAQYSPSIPPPPAPRRREDESPSTASPGTPTGLDFMKLLEAYRAIIDGSHAVSTTPGRTISADALEHMIQSAAFGAQMLESATLHEKPLSAPVGVTTTSSSEVAAMSPEEKEREDVNMNVKSSPNGSAPPSKRQKTDENSGSTEGQTCLGCNATSTPEWRRGPMGPRTLCNACGLVYAKLIKKRVRDRVSGKPKSTHLGNQRTAAVDDSGDGESDDEEYGSPGRRSDGGDGNSG